MYPNHAGVYLGDGLIGHHLYGRLSSKDVYGQFYRERTTHIMRHRKIRLKGELGKRFGKVHKLAVKTPAEAIRALCVLKKRI